MVGTKSRGYSNSGWLSVGEYSGPFFSTRPSPSIHDNSSTYYKVFYLSMHVYVKY